MSLIRTIKQATFIAFWSISSIAHADIIDVYVYNTEFSINPPGSPIVAATITAGDTIRWVWVQGNHTTTSVSGSTETWSTSLNSSSTEFMYQFNTPGVYVYYCIPHGTDNGDGTASGMWSTVTVLAAGSGACCLPDGSCTDSAEGSCISLGGNFSGVGTTCSTTACPLTASFTANKDNILFETTDGSLSNGAGQYLYVGNNNAGRRRSVLSFDLGTIPSYAEVQEAELQLYCNSSSGSSYPITLHKLLQDWGEGTSDAGGQEANGTNSTTGDATWLHSFYNTTLWDQSGGSYEPTVSATTNVDAASAAYRWSSSQLIVDVQNWVSAPSDNFGWIVRGDESTTNNTKRFSSIQGSVASEFPQLTIKYILPATGACCMPDASCTETSEQACINSGGTYQGDGTTCGTTSCSLNLTPFIDALPIPTVAVPETGSAGDVAHYKISMTEQFQQLHGELPPTRVWGYAGSYPGPTIEAYRDKQVTVEWVNDLRVAETGVLRTEHPLVVDQCLHGPDSTGNSPVTVVHLHGGKVSSQSDGNPEDIFPPGQSSGTYYYPNIQRAGTLWYHDHALGITRLNVTMGLAGFYLLRDDVEQSLNLPRGEYEIPLAIQDRSFNADGSLRYPDAWTDHFFGDVILVNGKVWPYLNVKQGKYRFRVLNGSSSRAYTLSLSDNSAFYEVGTELGLLEAPLPVTELTLMPGERAEIIVDFAGYSPGTEIILTNSAPAPYPGFPGVGVVPNVMKFVVQNQAGFTAAIPTSLTTIEELLETNSVTERLFELKQISGQNCGNQGQLAWTINGLMWDDITEFPMLGTTEIWTWHNESGIAHPMHMHLVSFQILDRQALDNAGQPTGPKLAPDPTEAGWKDTAISPPGYNTRVIARFEGFTGLFPYHCHILEHEDHEMMRQFRVVEPGQCQDSTASIIGCDSVTVNGIVYKSSGQYTQAITDPEIGCQSTLTLNITIHASTSSSEIVMACDSYSWNGTDYTTSGAYQFKTLNVNGCDSTATLVLTINKSSASASSVTACDSYLWKGTTYTTSGSYTFDTLNTVGCDSTMTLNLIIKKSTTSSQDVTACDSYAWNGVAYAASGTYTFKTLNSVGCDSTATLHLIINKSSTSSQDVTACDSYTWNQITYTALGTYTFKTLNSVGCDSTATLNLTINKRSFSTQNVTTCDSYTWNGITYTTSGTYNFETLNSVGCDSTATLQLTINKSSTSSQSVIACDSYTWNGITHTTSGTYTYVTLNNAGCDSIATLHLTIKNSTTSSQDITACDSNTWNGVTYTASGTYTFKTLNSVGCDSTATLNLTIKKSTTSSQYVAACDSYDWNDVEYTSSGTYTFKALNSVGCDSTATLHLTVLKSTNSSQSVVACDSYNWNSNTYISSGTYTFNTLNSVGCDSTATLNLTIKKSTTSSQNVIACDTYLWNGYEYTSSGIYAFNTTNSAGCDSTATLYLTINHSTEYTLNVTECNQYTLNGMEYTQTGLYEQHFENSAGCDSTLYLNLTIATAGTRTITDMACESYSAYGQVFTQSGVYQMFVSSGMACDSTITLDLTIVGLSNLVSIVGDQLIAQESRGAYQWYDCNSSLPISGATQQDFVPSETGSYSVEINYDGCTTTSSCEIVTIVGIESPGSNNKLYPNPTAGVVIFEAGSNLRNPMITVYDLAGRNTSVRTEKHGNAFIIDMMYLPKGVYIVLIEDFNYQRRYIVTKQ